MKEWTEREQSITAKARALVADQPPAFNLAPIIELVRAAEALGFDVVRRPVQHGDDPCGVKRMQTAAEVWQNYCDRTTEQNKGDI